MKNKKYIFNTSYILKNDLKRIIITNRGGRDLNKNDYETNKDFITVIHPIHNDAFFF